MKQTIFSAAGFSRAERLSLAAAGILLILLIMVRCTLTLWVHPAAIDGATQARLQAAYTAWKEKEAGKGTAMQEATAEAGNTLFTPEPFDPNTLDSAGFARLGMPAKAIKGLLSWRRKGKHFYKPEDLKPLYSLPAETYARLAPYIRIAGAGVPSFSARPFTDNYPAIPAIIDLNTADSALLDRGINGIGATLAHKIIARRTALGGFLRLEQLLEVYKFPDTTFQKLREKLRIDPAAVHKMNLNTATPAQLSAHPYIGENVAKNILMYREGIRRYERVDQLREAPLMTEEIYRRIAPYLSVE